MRLVTAKQMEMIDKKTIEEFKIPGIVLMENAAQGTVEIILKKIKNVFEMDVAAFCGRGHNGGDGLAILRILANLGIKTTGYILFSKKENIKKDVLVNLLAAKACGVVIVEIENEESFFKYEDLMLKHDFYIDALLGTGLNSLIRGVYLNIVSLINDRNVFVLSVDIPTGLNSDTGDIMGLAVKPNWTVTFGMIKQGLLLGNDDNIGKLYYVNISIPPRVVDALNIQTFLLNNDLVLDMVNKRYSESHKGSYGHVLVLGGSLGKSGAPCLSAAAAQKSGAGLVTLLLPKCLNLVAETSLISVMTCPMFETKDGFLSVRSLPFVLDLIDQKKVIVMGPGLGLNKESLELVTEVIENVNIPVVLDADGLGAMKGRLGEIDLRLKRIILTPHPGEAAKILDWSVSKVQKDRAVAVRSLANLTNSVVVLKGRRSLVANVDGKMWINPTGNQLLASAGTGDVLAGIIGAFLAQGCSDIEASCLGVFVHGLASDFALADYKDRGLIAENLINYIPSVFNFLKI